MKELASQLHGLKNVTYKTGRAFREALTSSIGEYVILQVNPGVPARDVRPSVKILARQEHELLLEVAVEPHGGVSLLDVYAGLLAE